MAAERKKMSGMSWVSAYLLAQLTPVLVSTGIWIILVAVQPWLVIVGPALAGLAVSASRTPPMVRLRFGVRSATPVERTLVLGALAVAPSLRGRGEPRVWIGRRLSDVRALSAQDLAVGEVVLERLRHGVADPEELAISAVVSFAPLRLRAETARALIATYCLPWRALGRLVGGVTRRTLGPVLKVVWWFRLLAVVSAVALQASQSRWGVAVGLAAVGLLACTTPALGRRWARARCRVRADAVMSDFGSAVVVDGDGKIAEGAPRSRQT